MTTVIVKDDTMVCDGQVTFGDRIDSTDFKKIRKINGCLVGGAGRLSSVLAFFDWFEGFTNSSIVRANAPEVDVLVPEGINDEDFTGIVMFTDKEVHIYEGGKRSYPVFSKDYYAIGSGADFALAALDAGATAEAALEVAKKRDVSTGGETFIEKLDIEDVTLSSRESAEKLSKDELLDMLFGEKSDTKDKQEDKLNEEGKVFTINELTKVSLFKEDSSVIIEVNEGNTNSIMYCFSLEEDLEQWLEIEMPVQEWKELAKYLDLKVSQKDGKRRVISKIRDSLINLVNLQSND